MITACSVRPTPPPAVFQLFRAIAEETDFSSEENRDTGNPPADGDSFTDKGQPFASATLVADDTTASLALLEELELRNRQLHSTVIDLSTKLHDLVVQNAELESAQSSYEDAIRDLEMKNETQMLKINVLESLLDDTSN